MSRWPASGAAIGCALAIALALAPPALAYEIGGTGAARGKADVLVAFRPLFTSAGDGRCGRTAGTTVHIAKPPPGITSYEVYRTTASGGQVLVGRSQPKDTEVFLPGLIAADQQMFNTLKSGSWTATSALSICTRFN